MFNNSVISILLLLASICWASKDYVQVWDDANFDKELKHQEYTLVMFYREGSEHYITLEEYYDKAAKIMLEYDPLIFFAKVDCAGAGSDTCLKHTYSGYPTFIVFNRDNVIEKYDGPIETAEEIIEYVKYYIRREMTELKTIDDLKSFLNFDDVSVVGFFKKHTALSEAYRIASQYLKNLVRFAHTSAKDIIEKEEYENEIIIYRPKALQNDFESPKIVYKGENSVDEIIKFIKKNYYGLVGIRTLKNSDDFHNPLVVVYSDVDYVGRRNKANLWRSTLAGIAKDYPEFTFVVSSQIEFKDLLNSYGLYFSGNFIVVAHDELERKFVLQHDVNLKKFEAFMKNLSLGVLEPYVKSEPIPEHNSGSVKIAVAKNFDDVVINNGKDTMILFYAPWDQYSKILTSTIQELADKLIDEEVEIVKFDGTANDVPYFYKIREYPTLYWLSKNAKDGPVEIFHRQLDDLVKYVAEYATEPLKNYYRDGKPIKYLDEL